MNIYKKIVILILLLNSYVDIPSAEEMSLKTIEMTMNTDEDSITHQEYLDLENGFKFCGRNLNQFIDAEKQDNPNFNMKSMKLKAENKIISVLAQDNINKEIFQESFIDLIARRLNLDSSITMKRIDGPNDTIREVYARVDVFYKFVKNTNFLKPIAYTYLKNCACEVNNKSMSMVEYAIYKDHRQALEYLESIGYYINDNATPLKLYQPMGWNNTQDTLQAPYVIHLAVEYKAINALTFLLHENRVNNSAQVNKKNASGKTPLALLASNSACFPYDPARTTIGKLLIQAQADIQETNEFGDTLLHLAAKEENYPIVGLLLEQDQSMYDKENNSGLIAWNVAGSSMREYLNKIKSGQIVIVAANSKQNTPGKTSTHSQQQSNHYPQQRNQGANNSSCNIL